MRVIFLSLVMLEPGHKIRMFCLFIFVLDLVAEDFLIS